MFEPGSGNPERVRELCRKLKPILGPQMERIFSAYMFEDIEGKRQIEMYLEALAAKRLPSRLDSTAVDLVPPSAETAKGPYSLGKVLYAGNPIHPFGLRENEWIQHVGVFGRSGAGKTNLGFEIFRQLILHGKPVLVFDWKRNYRDLLVLPEFKDVEVYTVGRDVSPFYFNPLIPPPGTDPKTWLKQIIEVVASGYMLGNGVLFLLMESVNAVYEEFGVYTGKVKRWPTFRDVLIKAKERNARGRESAWLSSALRALASLCFGHMDETLNTPHDQGKTIDALLQKSAILEMDALAQSDKVFLVSSFLLYIHHHRMADGVREVFRNSVIIEEAHHVLANERHSLIGGQSVMDITFREIREFGTGLVILDQSPSQISLSALANSYCTICLNLKHGKDVSAMSQAMLLESDEKDLLGSLEVGQAVVKLQGRAPKPFLISIPEFEITKGAVTDDALRIKMADVVRSPEPAIATAPLVAPHVAPISNPAPHQPAIDPVANFLRDILAHPESGVAARYKRLGISVRQGQRLKLRLIADGVLMETGEHTPTGRLLRLGLTEKGRTLLGSAQKAA